MFNMQGCKACTVCTANVLPAHVFPQGPLSPISAISKRVLFQATPSTKQLQAAAEGADSGSNNGKIMLEHNHMLKRSHTASDLSVAAGGCRVQVATYTSMGASSGQLAGLPHRCTL